MSVAVRSHVLKKSLMENFILCERFNSPWMTKVIEKETKIV